MRVTLDQLAGRRVEGRPAGIVSVCSAHPLVLRAALRHGVQTGTTVLIEATCNQVNHQGGYTGMQPADFAALVAAIASQEGCPPSQIVLGGDHLGPNPWRHLPAEQAMTEACSMVAAYVAAGFHKIHLDASMGCAGEPAALDDDTVAERAVRLAEVAETTALSHGLSLPCYIIGTEVPPPGGADHALDRIEPTSPQAARRTLAVHRARFAAAGLSAAMDRVIGLVVQPGVEFGNQNVIPYRREQARPLVSVLEDEPGLVFEAHSTDYQGAEPLAALVEDGFAILKVGPELTFVLREALYALDLIASDLVEDYPDRALKRAMEDIMQADPAHWNRHYQGDAGERAVLRHYSLSDRIRYYWASEAATAAVDRLLSALKGVTVPLPLMWQQLPAAAAQFAGRPLDPEAVLLWRVGQSLRTYQSACRTQEP